jgi:hypothetical protein
MQILSVKEKAKKSKRKTAYLKICKKFKDNYLPMFTEDEYIGTNKEYKWKCIKCRKYI